MTGPLILCATNRLAQGLRAAAPDDGAAVWNTPQAFPLEAWMDQLAEEAMLSGLLPALTLLDAFSERLLWQQIIADSIDPDGSPLFDSAAMAAKAADAYALASTWNLDDTSEAMSPEAQQFAAWRTAFRQRLLEEGWTVAADRRAALVAALEQGAMRIRAQVVFAGFDELNPLQRRLRVALDAQMRSSATSTSAVSLPAVVAFEDAGAECRAVAHWVRARFADDPVCRIGIVVPDLGSVRDQLEDALDEALHPELAAPAFAEHPRRYNFSLGRALAELPLIACALQLLELARAPYGIEQPVLTSLLLNPYWSESVHEADARARLDAQMRRRLQHRVDIDQLVTLGNKASAQSGTACPAALHHLSRLRHFAADCGAIMHPPSVWAHTVRTLLFESGWAGSAGQGCRTLSSHEYQAREAWSALLDQLARSDQPAGTLSYADVLAHLHGLCRERLFQPQTRGAPSVQVLGMLESAGLRFDALWVMGMHDGAWPPAPAPNPLLPVALQRAQGLPNSCAAVQLVHARAIVHRLLHQAAVVRFSCPLMAGSQELRHSPLFARADQVAAPAPDEAAPDLQGSQVLECLDDATGPVLGETERVRGGVALLRAQAICPAWAFYRYRLGAAALEHTQSGLDAQERGTLVHDALEWFWKQVNSRQALMVLAAVPEALEARIGAAVSASLSACEARMDVMPAAARELEALRLTRVLREWLQVEMRRADFTVLECERELRHQIGPVALTLRIDRIDRQDGKLVVIDYKTGIPGSIGNWAAMRITEPQLPIYALALSGAAPGEPVGALVFGKVRLGESRFTGLSATDKFVDRVRGMHKVPGAPFAAFTDWEALQAHWRERIAAVADEFARGVAGTDAGNAGDLAWCEVLPLLRLYERAACQTGFFTQSAGRNLQQIELES